MFAAIPPILASLGVTATELFLGATVVAASLTAAATISWLSRDSPKDREPNHDRENYGIVITDRNQFQDAKLMSMVIKSRNHEGGFFDKDELGQINSISIAQISQFKCFIQYYKVGEQKKPMIHCMLVLENTFSISTNSEKFPERKKKYVLVHANPKDQNTIIKICFSDSLDGIRSDIPKYGEKVKLVEIPAGNQMVTADPSFTGIEIRELFIDTIGRKFCVSSMESDEYKQKIMACLQNPEKLTQVFGSDQTNCILFAIQMLAKLDQERVVVKQMLDYMVANHQSK